MTGRNHKFKYNYNSNTLFRAFKFLYYLSIIIKNKIKRLISGNS